MSHEIDVQAQPRAWLMHSILQPHVSKYAEHLHRGRYAANTRRVYLCCVAHFAHWLTDERHTFDLVNEAGIARFISEHLPRCKCSYPVRRCDYEIRAAVAQLLEVLRAGGAISDELGVEDHIGRELVQFDAYMRDVGGLAANTRQQRQRVVGRFLAEQSGSGPIVATAITPKAVRRFVLGEKQGWSAGTVGVMGGAIGCYLRFRAMSGDHVGGLLAAIPRAAHWRLASLPEVLSDAEIEELLGSFDKPFPSSRRAFAMTRCLTDLGLRCGETVSLRLDDIDWVAGTIRVAGTKTRRVDVLPLPAETGAAIAAYLHDERPPTSNRAVFVRHVAPFDAPIGKGAVQRAVRAAYRRCGWTRTRVHILRHSVASRLLQAGTPMKEIADVLRHRSLDTSAIYAKVDLTRLASVALPWPGSVS
ncbi:MAG: site-specific integrase [Methyloceanibacter sp.]|jgi:integrase/recombinase XerD